MDIKNQSVPALLRAIQIAGSQSALGAALGHSQALVHKWINSRNPLKAEHCVKIERIYNVSRQDLRPDDWPDVWPELAYSTAKVVAIDPIKATAQEATHG